MKKLLLVFSVLTLIVLSAAAGFIYQLLEWSQTPRLVSPAMTIPFKAGTGLAHLSQDLEEFRIVDDGFKFQWYVRIFDDYRLFQAGLYQFEGELSPSQVIQKIQLGQVYRPIALQITIPEGFTLKQITERLAANGVGHIIALQNLVKDRDYIASLKLNAPTLEGYLYPATYSFESLPSPHNALARMVQTFFQNLPKDYEKNISEKGLTLHQAVTFASLIELETQLEEEKPLVSEVIWNRLNSKMPLGIDAALIYGIPDYKGDILWSHLADKSNPYNTRIHQGLPPTPIGSPGSNSLAAILTPSNFGYLYYVNIPGTTRHHFSKTLKEHNEQVKKLVESTKRPQGASLSPGDKDPPVKAPQTAPIDAPSDASNGPSPPKTSDLTGDSAPQTPLGEKPPDLNEAKPPPSASPSLTPPPSSPTATQKPSQPAKGKKSKSVASTPKKKAKSKDSKGTNKKNTMKGTSDGKNKGK